MMTNDFSFPGLAGRTCVISGGAGILGQAICKGLAGAGIQTAILDINMESAARLAGDLQSEFKTRCIGIGANVLNRESLENAREKILAELGPVDFLINGAGGNSAKATTTVETHHDASLDASLPDQKTFFDLDQAGFQFVFDLNFTGTVLTTQVFGEDMAQRGSGVILNISSMNSFRPLTKIPAYSAAKASINNLTQWLAVHFAKVNIRVNAIAPGFFLTNQNRFLLTDEKTGGLTARGNKIISNTPMGRFGEPFEVSGTLLYLISDSSKF